MKVAWASRRATNSSTSTSGAGVARGLPLPRTGCGRLLGGSRTLRCQGGPQAGGRPPEHLITLQGISHRWDLGHLWPHVDDAVERRPGAAASTGFVPI